MTRTGETVAVTTYGHFIGGEWIRSEKTFDDFEPYSGEVYAQISAGGAEEAERAVAAANAAFPDWAALPPAAKADLFLAAARIVEERRKEIAEVMARETGCTLPFADFQQDLVKAMLRQAANWVYLPAGELLRTDAPGTYSTAVRRPLGVVASFTPWNGANVLAWRTVLAPLAAGNTVVVKPSEEAPISAGLIVAQVAEAAGFPPGVVNVVTHAPGAAGPIADRFFEDPEVRCINFIGSVPTGRMLAERAGRELKRSVMELGGFNPLIVLDDVVLDDAVHVAVYSAFIHQGQVCLNARRIFVQESLYEEFLARFTARTRELVSGDPHRPGTFIGPLINDRARDLVHARVTEAVSKGARLVTGGTYDGRVYEPTILVDVPDDATVAQEETFGPVVLVQPVADAEEAVEIVNRSLYGLTASVLSGDTYRALELAGRIKSGAVHINLPTVNDEIQAPIGGVRDSGWGRSGPYALADFTDVIWVNARRDLPTDLPV
ncbi:aldehyde dehydrogenase family protein [Streptomyces sp. NPDC026672]|uniref:aldehyde dehydrogenase family protein n=1 Tax=unclassified Streptomyces TaxID=2593676 RepID=UPI0033C93123